MAQETVRLRCIAIAMALALVACVTLATGCAATFHHPQRVTLVTTSDGELDMLQSYLQARGADCERPGRCTLTVRADRHARAALLAYVDVLDRRMELEMMNGANVYVTANPGSTDPFPAVRHLTVRPDGSVEETADPPQVWKAYDPAHPHADEAGYILRIAEPGPYDARLDWQAARNTYESVVAALQLMDPGVVAPPRLHACPCQADSDR